MSWRLIQPTRLSAVVVVVLAASAAVSSSSSSVPLVGGTDEPVVHQHREARFSPLQPQPMEPWTTLVSTRDQNDPVRLGGPRGRHEWTTSQLAANDVPQAAMTAYRNVATSLGRTDPACGLPWTLLAAIGRVESDHGRYGGSVLATDGVTRPHIIGVALDGKGPVAAIHDTDDGRLDGDERWDRAIGPMQFIPSTWAWAGRDGDGDGRRDPHDLDDAALAAGDYLCTGSSLAGDAELDAAIFRYNPSDSYVRLVRAFEVGYRTGVFVIPSPDRPDEEPKAAKDKRADRDRRDGRDDRDRPPGAEAASAEPTPRPDPEASPTPRPKADPSPRPTPRPSGTPAPSQPTPDPGGATPTPTPQAPSPSPTPAVEEVAGPLAPCPGGWCVAGTLLDFGGDSALDAPAPQDYDGDGATERLADELTGLSGGVVTVQGERAGAVLVVRAINGLPFPR